MAPATDGSSDSGLLPTSNVGLAVLSLLVIFLTPVLVGFSFICCPKLCWCCCCCVNRSKQAGYAVVRNQEIDLPSYSADDEEDGAIDAGSNSDEHDDEVLDPEDLQTLKMINQYRDQLDEELQERESK